MVRTTARRLMAQLTLALALWTIVGLLSWAREPLGALITHGRPLSLWSALPYLTSCWLWALFTPPILWMSDRFPLERGSWAKNLVPHVTAAVATVIVGAPLLHVIWTALELSHSRSVGVQIVAELFIDIYSYAALIALGHALRYYRQSTAQQLRASELEAKLLAARIEALQARLQPHFLFNALNTVSSLIRTGESQAAVRAVARLGDLLRALLRDDGQEVPLSQELDFVGRYLELEQARFGDKLETRIDAEPEVLQALVPRLVLQPLVENALRHGIEPSSEPGRVVVTAARSGERLELEVRDTGTGAGPGTPSSRVGLANTRARLFQLYGERQELALTTDAAGTVARIVIPFHVGAG
jgi:two-component system LytT family sensor kinase